MMEEILPDLWRVEIPLPGSPLHHTNSYVVRGTHRNLVVDTGFDRKECLAAMRSALHSLDVDVERTDFFLTHAHADHAGLLPRLMGPHTRTFLNQPHSEVISAWTLGFPVEELKNILDNRPGTRLSPSWSPEHHVLEDGDTIEVGRFSFRCVRTPGHTPDHTCLLETKQKIFLAGDHLLPHLTPIVQCRSSRENPLQDYLDSLHKTTMLDIALVLPGHGNPFDAWRERIEEIRDHHRRRFREILAILERGPKDAYRTAAEMEWEVCYDHWDRFPVEQKWLAMGEATAHLRYLQECGKITTIRKGKRIVFRTVRS